MTVELWTDGACSGNPGGPGGWGALLRIDGVERELSGGDPSTTNNRMEMTAVLEGLRAFEDPSTVVIYIDSSYVKDGFDKDGLGNGLLPGWQARGWKKTNNKPVLNRDLWELLLVEVGRHQKVEWVKVEGHSGDELNDRVDALAVAACRTYGGRQPE